MWPATYRSSMLNDAFDLRLTFDDLSPSREESDPLVYIALNHPTSEIVNADECIQITTDSFTIPLSRLLSWGFELPSSITIVDVNKRDISPGVSKIMACDENDTKDGPYLKVLINMSYDPRVFVSNYYTRLHSKRRRECSV